MLLSEGRDKGDAEILASAERKLKAIEEEVHRPEPTAHLSLLRRMRALNQGG